MGPSVSSHRCCDLPSISKRPFTWDKAPINLLSSHSSGLRTEPSKKTLEKTKTKHQYAGTGINPFLTISSENLYSFYAKENKVLISYRAQERQYLSTGLLLVEFFNSGLLVHAVSTNTRCASIYFLSLIWSLLFWTAQSLTFSSPG